MILKEFQSMFSKLCKYYNKPDDAEIINIYYNQLKQLDINVNHLEQHIYKTCKYFPKVADIIEAYKKIKATIPVKSVNDKVCECALCNQTGYRMIIDNHNRQFAVACDCKNGDNKLYDGRIIKDVKHRSEYIVPRFSNLVFKY